MNKIELDVFSTACGNHYFQAGMCGLLIALRSLTINPYFAWENDDRKLTVTWTGDSEEAWTWLLNQTYQFRDGLLVTPTTGEQPIFFNQGMLNCVLSVPATRKIGDKLTVKVPMASGEATYSIVALTEIIHCRLGKAFKKGDLLPTMETKSWLLPNCTSDGIHKFSTSTEWYLALLFAPLLYSFYHIDECFGEKHRFSRALICPMVFNLNEIPSHKPQTPDAYVTTSLEDALLHYVSMNNIAAHGYQYYAEKSNRAARIINAKEVWDLNLIPVYQELRENLPNREWEGKIIANYLRGLGAKNILQGLSWYENFHQHPKLVEQVGFNRKGVRNLTFGG